MDLDTLPTAGTTPRRTQYAPRFDGRVHFSTFCAVKVVLGPPTLLSIRGRRACGPGGLRTTIRPFFVLVFVFIVIVVLIIVVIDHLSLVRLDWPTPDAPSSRSAPRGSPA